LQRISEKFWEISIGLHANAKSECQGVKITILETVWTPIRTAPIQSCCYIGSSDFLEVGELSYMQIIRKSKTRHTCFNTDNFIQCMFSHTDPWRNTPKMCYSSHVT
jgi:hypothetical protein